ncbi:hypothetical protein SeLEV6574_g05873 [Synchytrium endobioticum]|nr:hypothetical protein SeLEV6574_g05873 [Synchytrium endobioticum]
METYTASAPGRIATSSPPSQSIPSSSNAVPFPAAPPPSSSASTAPNSNTLRQSTQQLLPASGPQLPPIVSITESPPRNNESLPPLTSIGPHLHRAPQWHPHQEISINSASTRHPNHASPNAAPQQYHPQHHSSSPQPVLSNLGPPHSSISGNVKLAPPEPALPSFQTNVSGNVAAVLSRESAIGSSLSEPAVLSTHLNEAHIPERAHHQHHHSSHCHSHRDNSNAITKSKASGVKRSKGQDDDYQDPATPARKKKAQQQQQQQTLQQQSHYQARDSYHQPSQRAAVTSARLAASLMAEKEGWNTLYEEQEEPIPEQKHSPMLEGLRLNVLQRFQELQESFVKSKDTIYDEMVLRIRQEIQELNEGTHEGYISELEGYQHELNKAVKAAHLIYQHQLDSIATLYEQEKAELQELYEREKKDAQTKLMQIVEDKKRRVREERDVFDLSSLGDSTESPALPSPRIMATRSTAAKSSGNSLPINKDKRVRGQSSGSLYHGSGYAHATGARLEVKLAEDELLDDIAVIRKATGFTGARKYNTSDNPSEKLREAPVPSPTKLKIEHSRYFALHRIVKMFTGIIEAMGVVETQGLMEGKGTSLVIGNAAIVLTDVNIGDSICVNGVCLTVTEFDASRTKAKFGLAPETLRKSNLGELKPGDKVNLERAMASMTRFGGHMVQGHVDTTVTVERVTPDPPDSIIYAFKVPHSSPTEDTDFLNYIIPKGYVCLDGTSLTVVGVDVPNRTFSVMLIAHTQTAVVMPLKKVGDRVNLEVDQVAKYLDNIVSAFIESGRGGAALEQIIDKVVERKLKEIGKGKI